MSALRDARNGLMADVGGGGGGVRGGGGVGGVDGVESAVVGGGVGGVDASPLMVNGSVLGRSDVSSLPMDSAYVQHDHATYSPFTAFCFTVNYILGVGVLGMPYGFVRGGWLLSTLILFLISVFSWVTGMWIVQAQQRAKINLHQQHQLQLSQPPQPPQQAEGEGARDADAAQLLEVSGGSSPSSPRAHVVLYTPSLLDRRLELNELIGFFCGLRARRAYEVCLCVLIVGALWAYGAVFAGSMAVHLPISAFLSAGEVCSDESALSGSCASLYYFYLCIFACIVVPLTCRELTELKWVMIVLAVFRFVSLGLMMLTAVTALYSYPAPDIVEHTPAASPPYYSDMRAVLLAGSGVIFPIAVSSQLFHHSIPNLSFPLRPQSRVPHVFTAVLCTTFALYASLGICVGLFYGSSVQSTCTLSWADYTGRPDKDTASRPAWAAFISYVIVLFPPIDVLSAFPLNCITLANNVMAAFVTPQQATQRRYILPFRLLASLIPIVGAFIVKDLSTILHYAGSVGVGIAFLFPAALQFASLRAKAQTTAEEEAEEEAERRRAEQRPGGRGKRGSGYQQFSARAAEAASDGPLDVSDRRLIIHGRMAEALNSRMAFGSVATFAVIGLIAVVVLSIIDR